MLEESWSSKSRNFGLFSTRNMIGNENSLVPVGHWGIQSGHGWWYENSDFVLTEHWDGEPRFISTILMVSHI